MDIVSSPKVGRSLPKTIMLVVRSSGLWEAYTQTRASLNKHDGFDRERPTFGDETISITSSCFQIFLEST